MKDIPQVDEFILQNACMPPKAFQTKINLKQTLGIIGQFNHIIISKNLTEKQTTAIIDNCTTMISFIEKDYYPIRRFNIWGSHK